MAPAEITHAEGEEKDELLIVSTGEPVVGEPLLPSSSSISLSAEERIKRLKRSKRTEDALFQGPVTYTWSNITCEANTGGKLFKHKKLPATNSSNTSKKIILNGVSGVVKSGEIWALMGASGAGKTTLLNLLNFRTSHKLHITGDRCINGSPIGQAVISSISAYVQQDDLFIPLLTVREHLLFSSLMRMDSDISRKDRHSRVDAVLKELGLWGSRNSYIGGAASFKGISGGERKRLAFAAEVLTDPTILFCDEPTSGLDSFMAQTVVDIMQQMAKRGKIIICTIHQPSTDIFNRFNHLYLLTEGRLVFSGLREEALSFFEKGGYICPVTHNPADYYIRTLSIIPDDAENCRQRTQALAETFIGTEVYHKIIAESSKRSRGKNADIASIEEKMRGKNLVIKASNWKQFTGLTWRCFLILRRDPYLSSVKLMQNITIGFFFAAVFYKDNYTIESARAVSLAGIVVVSVFLEFMLSTFSVLCTFSLEIPVFLREHWNGMYKCWIYYTAKTLADFPALCFFPIVYFPQLFYLSKMHGDLITFGWHYLTLVAVSQAGAAIGYSISTWTKNVQMALVISPLVLAPIIILSGLFIAEEAVFECFKWLKYLSVTYYASENAMELQWGSKDVKITPSNPLIPSIFKEGPDVLTYFNYKKGNFYWNFLGMFGLFVLFRIVAYTGLYRKTKI